MANLDNLMSFSSDEEDNAAMKSEVSWRTVLSDFNVSPRSRSGTESSRSLSPNFSHSDSHQPSNGRSDSKYSYHSVQAVKTETRSPKSPFPVDGDHLKWVDVLSDFERGRDSNLCNQEFKLRASRSWDALSPPRSPVKKQSNIPQFPQGGFDNYHKAFRPPSVCLDSERTMNDSEALKNSHRSPSYTSSLSVTLNNQNSDLNIQSTDQSIVSSASSNSGSEHPYGSIILKPKGELSITGSKEEILSSGKSPTYDSVFPVEMTGSAEKFPSVSRNTRPLKVQLPDDESSKNSVRSQKETASHSKSVPHPHPPVPKKPNRPFSASFPNKKSTAGSMSSDCNSKFLFYGDGLFDVAKERNEEAAAFSVTMTKLRSDFHWDDETNPGHVISPTIPYDYQTFHRYIEASIDRKSVV